MIVCVCNCWLSWFYRSLYPALDFPINFCFWIAFPGGACRILWGSIMMKGIEKLSFHSSFSPFSFLPVPYASVVDYIYRLVNGKCSIFSQYPCVFQRQTNTHTQRYIMCSTTFRGCTVSFKCLRQILDATFSLDLWIHKWIKRRREFMLVVCVRKPNGKWWTKTKRY